MKLKYSILFFCLFSISTFAGTEYQFATISSENCRIAEIQDKLNQEYHSLMAKRKFDRSMSYLDSNLNPLTATDDAIETVQVNSLKRYLETGAGNCIGLARGYAHDLTALFGLQFKVIASTVPPASRQGNMPRLSHAAAFLRCTDGAALIDPGLNIPEVLYFSEKSANQLDVAGRGLWKYTQDQDVIRLTYETYIPDSSDRKPAVEWIFDVRELLNPDEAITRWHFQNDRRILIYRDDNYRLTLNLLKFQIEYTNAPAGKNSQQIFTHSFEEYKKNPGLIQEWITQAVSENLGMPRDMLIHHIVRVMNQVGFAPEAK